MSRLTALIRAWRARRSTPRAEEESADRFELRPIRRPHDHVRVHVDWRPLVNLAAAEYPELGIGDQAVLAGDPAPVFITARFRTGSTLLWNIFRHLPELTTYYEPLHPWLALPSAQRPTVPDPTHYDVEEYWSEYDRIPNLQQMFTEPWDREDLYLDALDWKPALAAYIRLLISSAGGRAVLQFNRVDFRLDWLRHVFPEAQLVHLFRHPRDQWLSTMRRSAPFGRDDPLERFAEHDAYFLGDWVRDLSSHFPMLDWQLVSHPYEMFYLVWKLSYIWGKAYSGFSLSYEQLLAAPHAALRDLFGFLDLDPQFVPRAAALVRPSGNSRWQTYADGAWFAARERAAEKLLDKMLGRRPDPVAVSMRLRASA